jgi:lambda family phage portal protein
MAGLLTRIRNRFTTTVYRAFEVGRTGRRLASVPNVTTAINSLIRRYGRTVIARSRYLCENNPYATQARSVYVAALAGTGIKPASLLKNQPGAREALQELWMDWTDEADADMLTDFYGLQSIIATELFEAGECFVRIRPRREGDMDTVPMQLQLLPSEMLPYDNHQFGIGAGNRIEMGIEFDGIGRRVAYHFLRQHPGADTSVILGPTSTIRVPASEVLHIYNPIRAGQLRGIPKTLSSMITLAMMDLYDDAELERKRTTALFAVFVTRPKGEDGDHPFGVAGEHVQRDVTGTYPNAGSLVGSNTSSTGEFNLDPGAVIDLGYGEDVKFSAPADVGNQYEAYQYRMLLRAAAGMGVPYASMTGDLRSANYGSIRAGLVEFRRQVEAEQHRTMVFQFCRPVWRRWFGLAVIAGLLPWTPQAFDADMRAITRVKWVPPKWDWVDPLKDLQAEALAVEKGFKARGDVIEATGHDPEEVDNRIAADQEREERLGLNFSAQPAPSPGGDGSVDGGDGEDDEEPDEETPAEEDDEDADEE